ncbi:MAG: class I SAM-dependent methyltransferase [Fluviicola sp.]
MPHDILTYFGDSHAEFLHAHGLKSTTVLIQHLNCQPQESVLEIGFGTGATLVEVVSRFPQTTFFGWEESEKMFDTAQKRLKFCDLEDKVSLHLKEKHSFGQGQFDTVYLESVLAIQSRESLEKLLSNIQSWLKPGGILICNETVWLPSVPISQINEINKRCLREFGIVQAIGDFPYAENWLQLFESFGFKMIQSNPIDQEIFSVAIEQNPASKRFTRKGKIRSKLNPKAHKEWKKYKRVMQDIFPSETSFMEGWLFKMELPK